MVLTQYPSLTAEEFKQACEAFESRCVDRRGLDGSDWLMVRWTGHEMRIKQRRKTDGNSRHEEKMEIVVASASAGDAGIAAGLDDDDEEAIASAAQMDGQHQPHADVHVHYDIDFSITYSLTYSVPVLWFWSPKLTTIEHVHAIGPEHLDEAVRSVGVMGGISRAYHPVTDMPAFFIHPCNTHSAMHAVVHDGAKLSQEDYLLIWLGLTGSSLGLHVPSHLLTHQNVYT